MSNETLRELRLQLNALLADDDLSADKLRHASENLLPNLHDALLDLDALSQPMPEAAQGWIPVDRQMPKSGQIVLALQKWDHSGKLSVIRAAWVAAKTEESSPESDIGEYDEATDTYYDPEGWYEQISHWDEIGAAGVSGATIVAWMPLPDVLSASPAAPAQPQATEGEPEVVACCGHASDCAVHNAPALPPGPCDCLPTPQMCRAAVEYMNGADVYKKVPPEVTEIEEGIYREVWLAMQKVAPQPQATEGEPEVVFEFGEDEVPTFHDGPRSSQHELESVVDAKRCTQLVTYVTEAREALAQHRAALEKMQEALEEARKLYGLGASTRRKLTAAITEAEQVMKGEGV